MNRELTIGILAFIAGVLIANARARQKVRNAASATEKEVRNAIDALLIEAETRGLSINQFREALQDTDEK